MASLLLRSNTGALNAARCHEVSASATPKFNCLTMVCEASSLPLHSSTVPLSAQAPEVQQEVLWQSPCCCSRSSFGRAPTAAAGAPLTVAARGPLAEALVLQQEVPWQRPYCCSRRCLGRGFTAAAGTPLLLLQQPFLSIPELASMEF